MASHPTPHVFKPHSLVQFDSHFREVLARRGKFAGQRRLLSIHLGRPHGPVDVAKVIFNSGRKHDGHRIYVCKDGRVVAHDTGKAEHWFDTGHKVKIE